MKVPCVKQISLEKLEQDIALLERDTPMPAIEEIQELYQKIDAAKKELEAAKRWYHKFFGDLKKVGKMQQQLQHFLEEAKKRKVQEVINKKLWELQRKGLLSHQESEEVKKALSACAPQMQAIRCPHVFTLVVVSQKEGLLDLILFSEENERHLQYSVKVFDCYAVGEKQFDTVEVLIAEIAPYAMPLSQMQEIAGLLETHSTGKGTISHILSTRTIEQKLSSLLKSYPQGAYILHPPQEETDRNSLILSRIHQKGKIDHLKIDLEKHLGHYTICDERQTRVQFKRRLEQMGIPLRLRMIDGE